MSNAKAIRERTEALKAQFKGQSGGITYTPKTETVETERKNTGSNTLYVLEKLGLGAMRGIEGFSDYVVGGIADLFGADDFAENIMRNDWVNYEHADEWFNPGKGWQFAGDVASGIGNILPSVTLTLATGGAGGAVAAAGAAAGTGQFIGSAMGQATSEAVKKTGDLSGNEWLYGTASGALEGLIEKATGGIGGTQAGKVLGKQLGKTALGKVGIAFAGEGAEEVASDVFNPLLERVTGVDETAKIDWAGMPRTFLVGGTTGAVMGGISKGIDAVKAGGFKKANAQERLQELEQRNADNNLRQADEKKETYTQEDINNTKLSLSTELQKMAPDVRETFIKDNKLENVFNENGMVKENAPAPENYNTDSYSASLQGQESTLAFKPVSVGSKVADAAKKTMSTLTKLMKGNTNIVLTDEPITTESGEKANGLYKDGVIYLDANATMDDKVQTVGAHEIIHTLEGTKEYNDLAKYVAETISNDPALQKKYNYEKYRAVYDSILQGDWSETTKDYQATTEIFADYLANEVLSNEDILNRLAKRKDKGVLGTILGKLVEWIKEAIDRFGMSELDLEAKRVLRNMERKLGKALDAGRGGVSLETVEEYAKASEKATVAKNATPALARAKIDIDNFDPLLYNEIQLPRQEYDRLWSEAMQWDGKKRNILTSRTLSNEYTYRYMIDENNRLHVYEKREMGNIHERGNEYDKQSREKLNTAVQGVWTEQAKDVGDTVFERGRTRTADTSNNRQVQSEGQRDGRRYSKNVNDADRSQERKGIVYFDSESVEKASQDRKQRKTSSARFSLEYSKVIAERQLKDNEKFGFHVTDEKLNEAIESTARMVDRMSKHLDILPEDKIGKKNETIKSNSSYDKSIENTTICVRTLSYNQFVDKVQERLGRPLTQAESFLASQKLYEIAVDPQCLYCYVSLDRKAYNEFLLRYINERDAVIEKYKQSNKSKKAVEKLYEEYRDNRKDTENMRKRFDMFIEMAEKGITPLSAKDVSTKARQSEIASRGDYTSVQWKDMAAYAQSASWAKKQQDYVAYFNDILNLSKVAVDNLNKHYGLRFYSFSDYTAAFIVENMQQVTDAAIRGLKGLGYTKDVDFARIFAPTGMNINISMYAHQNAKTGEWEIDPRQSANLEDAIKLRDQYPNVGIVVTASTDAGVEWALKQKWSDVVIPFHIVRTGADVAEFYKWQNYTAESADTIADEKLWNAYVNGRKKVSKNIYPAEHQNNKEAYLKLIKERGLKPRFERFLDNPNYMKLVNETRQSAKDTKPMQPIFDVGAAEKSFDAFVGKGGYFKGWYKEGVNVDAEAEAVAKDVAEGKKANEVDYGRQDVDFDKVASSRRANRTHSRASIDVDSALADFPSIDKWFDSLTAEELRELIDNDYSVKDISEELNVEPQKLRYLIKREGLGNSYLEDSKKAVMKQTRIDEAIEDSGASNPTYARDYITAISPKDFIDLTVTKNHVERDAFDAEVIGDHGSKMGEYDYEKALQTSRSPYLQIDKATGRVIGHNGRHRIRALEKAGIESVEIQVEFFDEDGRLMKYGAETIPKMAISSQFDTDIETTILKIIPLNESHRAEIENTYGERANPNAGVRYSLDTELDKKTTERVKTVVSDHKKSVQEVWDDTLDNIKKGSVNQWLKAQIELTDEQAGILLAGRNVDEVLNGEVQRARSAKGAAVNMLNNEQRDFSGKNRVGDSLNAIFAPIHKKGEIYSRDFNLYLLHTLNVDRMSAIANAKAKIENLFKANPNLKDVISSGYASEAEWQQAVKAEEGGKEYLRLIETENKAVFQEEVTAEFSKEKLAQLDKQYPEFKTNAEKVWKYSQNLLQYRVDAGLITQEQADQMMEMYPHYVPAFYEEVKQSASGASLGKSGVSVKTGIRKAQGSTGVADLSDVSTSMSKQTMAVIRAASINKVAEKLYDGAVRTNNFMDVELASREKLNDPDIDYDKEVPKDNQVFFYKDGERITLNVSEYVFAGFEGLTAGAQFTGPLTSLSAKAIGLFKKLVTSWNPLFSITNAVRDVQEAFFYSKYGAFKFLGRYGKSLFARRNDPKLKELWQQYVAMGGTSSGYFASDTGIYDNRSKPKKAVSKVLEKLDAINNYVEQTPRFAEFVASVEAGNSLEQALYDSAEVTTNFSRGGRTAKKLNRCLVPFLNPSIQGWSKLWRSYAVPMDKLSANEIQNASKSEQKRLILSRYGTLIIKSIALGIGVGLFNDMLYRWFDDDEDYKNLPLNMKENYYLIKIGKKFIKLPKGRVLALYGSVATRIAEYANGNEDALDAWDWYKSASNMVSPLESASRTILAPIYDAKTNTTWYGGQIENASMENLAPEDRYDEGTSSIAITIGRMFNISPKKVHYVLDQYSGVLGDFILPKTTNKAEKGMISSRFVVDPMYNNDIATKYYDYKEELTYAKNSGDINAKMMLKYINQVQEDLSDMYQQKRDIANDTSLSNKEKQEQTQIYQSLINGTLSSSIENAKAFEQILIDSRFEEAVGVLTSSNAYKKMDETTQKYAYNKLVGYYYEVCNSTLNNTKVGYKYALYGAINATDIVSYLADIKNIEADKDKKGNTISGSRKEKVHKYIQSLRLTAQQKYILMYLAGYKPTEAGQKTVEAYLKKQGYKAEEISDLWN